MRQPEDFGWRIFYFYYSYFLNTLKINITMAIMKVIEIMSDSKKSWEDATAKGVARAGKSVKGIKSAYVQSQSVVVNNNKVTSYRVNLKVTFEVK